MSYYVGLDPASSHVGLAAISDTGSIVHRALHVRGDMPTRLVALRREARAWLDELAVTGTWCCVAEKPVTRFGGATLLASYGVLVEAASSSLTCPVLTLTPKQVDAAALGFPVPAKTRKTRLMDHARSLGYEGGSQDIADALACADAARVLTARSLDGEAA